MPAPHLISVCAAASLAVLLSACAPSSYSLIQPATSNLARLSEPAANETVIVINNNSLGGTHAGIFAGVRLNDPSGSYVGKRREADASWPGPTLADYVEFQLEDGERVELFRFRLNAADFQELETRMVAAGPTPPLFCAAEVKNLIGGIGPFAGIDRDGWISPSGLSERLAELIEIKVGECELPNRRPC